MINARVSRILKNNSNPTPVFEKRFKMFAKKNIIENDTIKVWVSNELMTNKLLVINFLIIFLTWSIVEEILKFR